MKHNHQLALSEDEEAGGGLDINKSGTWEIFWQPLYLWEGR